MGAGSSTRSFSRAGASRPVCVSCAEASRSERVVCATSRVPPRPCTYLRGTRAAPRRGPSRFGRRRRARPTPPWLRGKVAAVDRTFDFAKSFGAGCPSRRRTRGLATGRRRCRARSRTRPAPAWKPRATPTAACAASSCHSASRAFRRRGSATGRGAAGMTGLAFPETWSGTSGARGGTRRASARSAAHIRPRMRRASRRPETGCHPRSRKDACGSRPAARDRRALHHLPVERRDGLGDESDRGLVALDGRHEEPVVDEVEGHREEAFAVRNERRRQAARCDVERACQEWLIQGVWVSRTLPTIWVQRWSVSRVPPTRERNIGPRLGGHDAGSRKTSST